MAGFGGWGGVCHGQEPDLLLPLTVCDFGKMTYSLADLNLLLCKTGVTVVAVTF